MIVSETASTPLPGVLAHIDAVRASVESCASDSGPSRAGTMQHVPRKMVAVTVALSEPMDSAPLDWADTIAANLRLLYANTTVEVIDSWRVDQ